ncbi:MAG: citramalate synthase [Bacteroidetes bacterium]|nr:citramalate synthase [Bacteroidota bacterium]
MKKIEIFDTTLRDGTQGEHVSVSVNDKLLITRKLDEFGVDFIEGGWPGSNPKDAEFFRKVKSVNLQAAKLCAFGSTARSLDAVKEDANLNALLQAETSVVTIFGKSWNLHSQHGLGLTEEQNEELIFRSVEYLRSEGRQVIFDAEHFFDGYKNNPDFAIRMLLSAQKAGASTLTLCDTNGGTLPHEIAEIVKTVAGKVALPLGIHAHNDSELAVANSLSAVENGVTHVQGTINGIGERCGNANLVSIIPNLILKQKRETVRPINLQNLSSISLFIYETMNLVPNSRQAFVGKSAFAHKGGIHVSAVLKDSRMYEHIEPEKVGNKQRVLVSDLSGQSNVRYKAQQLGLDLDSDKELAKRVVDRIKEMEFNGYQFEGADASFELLLRGEMGEFHPYFNLIDSKINISSNDIRHLSHAEAVLKLEVDGEIEHTAADGNGPVNALDNALRKALCRFYPSITETELVDYKVRVLDEKDGTNANVRVLVETSDRKDVWVTVGVSRNIIEASLHAIIDGLNYKLFKDKVKSKFSV